MESNFLKISIGVQHFLEAGGSLISDDKKWTMTLHRVAYAYEKTQEKIHAAGPPAPLADRLALGR